MTSLRRAVLYCLLSVFANNVFAQSILPVTAVDPASTQAASPRLIAFSDSIDGQPDGALTVTFSLYPDQPGAAALWTETQVVQVTGGKYSVLLGSTDPAGIPATAFTSSQAHWLGVQVNGTEKRHLLVSVPYAMKAVEAESFGGLLPSQYVTLAQLQSILQNSTSAGTGGSNGTTINSGPIQTAAAAGSTPQPATDFTDSNDSEVLLVTQQGTGYAIHAISTGGPRETIFGENDVAFGTAMRAFASAQSSQTIGLLAEVASPDGISGVFVNRAGGKILSLRNTFGEVVSVDQNGNVNTTGSFSGNGFGLSNIPPSAVGAQSANFPNAIVARDANGGFSAGQISAQNFIGNGFGLTNISPQAVGAQPGNIPNSIVLRDINGDFAANQITAQNFIGSGFGLTNISPQAVGAQPGNIPNSIVLRDINGDFAANQITAQNFIGNGFGLTNISPLAVGAQPGNIPNSIVLRDINGNFAASQISAQNFIGNGFGLTNISPQAVGAQPGNIPNSIVLRDINGDFAANQINATGLILSGNADFTAASSTAPVKAVLSANTPTSCATSKELLIKTDAPAGQQLFICNATGNGYVLVGDGTAAGVTSVAAGDGSVTVAGTAAQPTVSVASGGITSDKLAPNAVTSVSIADGSLSPAKIVGTAATLGANSYSGTQAMPALNAGTVIASGSISASTISSAAGGTFAGPTTVNTASGTALTVKGGDSTNPGLTALNQAINGIALQATSSGNTGIGVLGRATGGQSVAGLFVNTQGNGRIISAGVGAGTFGSEVFSVDTAGNVFNGGAQVAQFSNSPSGTTPAGLAKIDLNGFALSTAPGDTTGAVGIVVSNAGTFGPVRIAYGGTAFCVFDSLPHIQDYVQISRTTPGQCSDAGPNYPTSGQVIGRVTGVGGGTGAFVLLSGPSTQALKSGVLSISTGPGLVGGPITNSGTISIANNGVTNAMLQNSSLIVNPGVGLSGGGVAPLGGSVTLNNAGALSFNGRAGNVVAAPGDYTFSQISGSASSAQLPASTVFSNQSNTFSADQTINGNLNATNANLQSAAVNATSSQFTLAPLQVNDNGFAPSALYAFSQNGKAAAFQGAGPVLLSANNMVEDVFTVTRNGNMTVLSDVSARTFSGDGSNLFNVNASTLGGVAVSNLATTAALNAETAARQSDAANLQTSIGTESAARLSGDAALSASISAETSARQSDVSNLQSNISAVSAADAKLAASNTFTAGTQDLSGAAATLPVHAVLTANTPASCVAGKELLIKTDALPGQQLFICDANGASWNLVGDGASGGVTSFNGRSGSISPAANDYSFSQISGSVTPAQLPAFNGDVTTAAGSNLTVLAASGVTAGSYSKVSVDLKGRVTSGTQAGFSDLAGSVTSAQLPANVVYSDKANTFTAGQTVNGTVSASAFSGNGSAVTNVNAATLSGIGASGFAQLAVSNSFTAKQTLATPTTSTASLNLPAGVAPSAPSSGDVWNSGTAIQYRDNASTTRSLVSTTQSGGMQLLKLTATITPASVGSQACTEQSFTVSGIAAADMLLSVGQPSTSSPGPNIAIGGWRVSAVNTVAIQFCNVSRNASTPVAGSYTLAVMR